MKKIILIVTASVNVCLLFSQNIGIGTALPHASAKLEVQSSNSGFLTPRMSTAQRDAITTPATGLIIFNVNTVQFEFFNGTEWISFSGGGGKWGNKQQLSHESFASQVLLFYKSDGTTTGKQLGNDIALNGNYMAAGVPGDFDPFGTVASLGSVRMFKRTAEKWDYYNVLYPTDQNSTSYFGRSVALEGNTLLVGAPSASVNGLFNRGKIYYYLLDTSGVPVYQSAINANDHHSGDYYGNSVSVSGNNAVVGASGYSVGAQLDRGAAYFLTRNNNIWTQHSVVLAPDGLSEDVFGTTVSISGNTAAIAAPHSKVNNLIRVGKVYIYQLINNTWTYMTTLTPPIIARMEKFGSDLHLKGDTLVIGASQFNGPIDNKAGKVYVYVRSGNSWNLQATLSPSDGKTADAFGSSVHYNAGYIIAGSPNAEVMANENQGKAYAFKMENGNWIEEAILTPSSGNQNDWFGSAVAIIPDMAISSAIHAPFDGWSQHGRVYFFKK